MKNGGRAPGRRAASPRVVARSRSTGVARTAGAVEGRLTRMDTNRKLRAVAEDIVLTSSANTTQAAEAPHR